MKFKISNETKVGIIATVAILLIILGVNFLRGKNIFSTNINLSTRLTNASGLAASNPVMLYGLKVGTVDKVSLINEGPFKILVQFHINGDVEVARNSEVHVNSNDLLGPRVLEFHPGNSTQFLANKDTVRGMVDPSLVESLSSTVSPVRDKVEKLVTSIDTMVTSLNSVLDKEGARSLKMSFVSLHNSLANVEAATSRLGNMLSPEMNTRFQAIMANVQHITESVKNYDASINRAVNNFASISDTLRALNLRKTIDQANDAITRVDNIIAKVEKGEGSLGMLVNDKRLYNNLQSASVNLDKLLFDLRENPDRYINVSLVRINTRKPAKYTGPDTSGSKH